MYNNEGDDDQDDMGKEDVANVRMAMMSMEEKIPT
jgi:hypothetical protein